MKPKHKSLLRYLILWMGVGSIFFLCPHSIIAADGEFSDSATNLHIFIPDDATEDSCGHWISDTINVSGQPYRAYVTWVDVSFTINHTYLPDLIVELERPSDSVVYVLWETNGTYSPYYEYGIIQFNDLNVNGDWILWVCDCWQDSVGYLEAWGLTIYYTVPPPSAPTNLTVTSVGDGKVSLRWNAVPETDCDGYYVYWDTLSTVSSQNYHDFARIDRRTDTTYTVYPLPDRLFNGVKHYFVVNATDESGNEGSESNKVNATPNEFPTLDYPGADDWKQSHFTNYGNDNRLIYDVQYVVIHVAEGSYLGTIDWFQRYHDPDSGFKPSSANYVVSKYGEITQMVHHDDVAFHAGYPYPSFNYISIGIEHEGFREIGECFTDEMYEASAKLVRYLCDMCALPKDTFHIIGHNKIPGGTSPCPGTLWNWKKYMKLISGTYAPEEELIWDYYLSQNFPNPFNTITSICYNVKSKGKVNLTVYNILGRKVRTLVNQVQNPNRYEVKWDGKDDSGKEVSSGIYFCRMKVGDFEEVRKMCLLK